MKPYISFFKLRFNIALQYRTAAIAGVLTQFFWGIMQILMYQAFYRTVTSQNISLEQLVTYIWLKQAFYTITNPSTDKEIKTLIETGNISYELCRPTNLYWIWFFKTLANRTAGTFLKCIPMLLVTPFLPGVMALQGPAGILEFVTTIVNCFHLSIFYTLTSRGTNSIFYATAQFFGGGFIPIALMPKFWQTLCYCLPFSLTGDLPYRLYSGNIPIENSITYIFMQIGWLIGLTLICLLITHRRLARVVVQGG